MYVLALDQGTTSSRAAVVSSDGLIKAVAFRPLKQYYPRPGWVEHDPMEIFSGQLEAANEVLFKAQVEPRQIAAIGLTNQRETVVVWDRQTGDPIYPAIVWQCRRSAALCDEYLQAGQAELVAERTGLIIDAYFSATKLRWLLDNVDGARQKALQGRLAAGTVDSWLVWRLSGGKAHITDVSNASRTMLFNIHTLDWDDELLALFDIPRSILPQIVPSSGIVARTTGEFFGGVPVAGMAGDQQAALFGQGCFEQGQAKITYGTGCFVLLNTGEEVVRSKNKLLTTVAWQALGKTIYALEGSVFIAGAAVDWLRDVGLIGSAAETAEIASSVADSAGVYFVPAFVGLGAPYWDQYARGVIVGLERRTTRAHIVRAVLESIAYQTRDLLEALQSDVSFPLAASIRVDGGVSKNDFLMQFQADILNRCVLRPAQTETTVLGAAYLAGLGCGFWQDIEQIKANVEAGARVFTALMQEPARNKLYDRWRKAVECALGWEER